MVHTQLAIVEPSNRFAVLPFNLTFDIVNVKTKQSTINLAVNKDDDATAEKMFMEMEKRRWRHQGGGRGRRDGMWFNKEGNDEKAKAIRITIYRCPRNIGVRMKGIRRWGRAMRCNNNKNGSERDNDGAVVYS